MCAAGLLLFQLPFFFLEIYGDAARTGPGKSFYVCGCSCLVRSIIAIIRPFLIVTRGVDSFSPPYMHFYPVSYSAAAFSEYKTSDNTASVIAAIAYNHRGT